VAQIAKQLRFPQKRSTLRNARLRTFLVTTQRIQPL